MSKQPVVRRTVGAALVILCLTACSPQASTAADGRGGASAAAAPPVAQAVSPAASADPMPRTGLSGAVLPDFTALVDRFGPAVVNVRVVGKRQTISGPGGLSPDDPFYEFFRRFGIPAPGQGGPRGQAPAPRGEGSGFIVSPDGYILTNAHVVDAADEVTVRMTDRREYSAKVIGLDKRTDVAVLKIEASNLPVVKLGDPARLRAGEWVIAIGSPFGFDNSVTAGVVSATSRSLPGEDSNYVPFIQTDVAVNPGNSGGPLFNLDGEVVGINSQIYSRTGGYMGLSFAIPIDLASDVKDQLIKTGKVSRGRIGVSIQEVNAQFAESFGLDRPRGALVGSVENDGPADKAGVKPGDIILSANGRSIERSSELPAVIAAVRAGTDTPLEVWRDRGVRKLTVKVGELVESGERVTQTRADSANSENRLGLAVRELTAAEQRQADTRGSLLVEASEGPAADAGVQPGDVILGVNGRNVKSLKELREATTKAGKTVALLIQRQDAQIFVPLRMP
ncbi:MAG: DegQ family serine endoprotease [Steroidobacteraceae bacterium]|nr:DegQ family serine endoprotease [Nevskiaceae bacterium]MCP5360755.1 DegQ family serine endoprotease [Nevskiaceae bacterium]